MMSKKEFNQFLKEIGGLINSKGPLPHPISLFGIECDDGWLEMIPQLIRELVDAGWTREIRQIKKKSSVAFGFMRTGYQKTDMKLLRDTKRAHTQRVRFAEVTIT